MSEFFDKRSSAKTPRIYKEYRDFIINKYRENPKQALTFAEVRRMVIGDVNSLSRVFEFLEHWGLINQQVAGDQGAAEGAGPVVSVMDSFPSGINVVRMPVASGARIPGIATFESSGVWEVCADAGPVVELGLAMWMANRPRILKWDEVVLFR